MKKFISFLGILTIAVFFLVGTTAGLRTTYNISALFIPGKIEIKNLSGQLIKQISFDELHYSNESMKLDISSLSFNWNPSSLFSKRISINSIKIDNANLLLKESHLNASKQTLPESKSKTIENYIEDAVAGLKSIEIKHADIQKIFIRNNKTTLFQLNQFIMTPKQNDIQTLNMQSSIGDITGELSIDYNKAFSWSIHLASNNINLSTISSELQGLFQFTINTQGIWYSRVKKMALSISRLKGSFNGYPLDATADIKWENDHLHIKDLSAQYNNARLIIASHKVKQNTLTWQLNIPQLNTIIPEYHANIISSGEIIKINEEPALSANIQIKRFQSDGLRAKEITVDINTNTTNGINDKTTALIKGVGNDQFLLPSLRIDSETQFVKENLTNKMRISLDDNNYLLGNLTLEKLNFANLLKQRIYGQFSVHLNDLSQLNKAFTKPKLISSLKGAASGEVNINGNIGKPQINCKLNVTNASLLITAYGTQVNDLTLRVSYQQDQPLHFDSQFVLGGGKASLGGIVTLPPDKLSAQLVLDGDRLLLADTKEYRIFASPDLHINYSDNLIHVNGTINIPEAKIEPVDFSATTTLPDDVVIVNQMKKDDRTPTNLDLSVRVTLGDKVYLDVYNLKAQLKGDLRISQNPGNPPTATGELNLVGGEYKAYGKHLIIERGRLFYTGSLLTNPNIDLRAYQRTSTTQVASGSDFASSAGSSYTGSSRLNVGIVARGNIKNPNISFYSDPAGLSQGDILSYLLVGQPQAANANPMALLGAASGLLGGDSPTDSIQGKLGLEELTIGSTDYYDPNESQQKSSKTVNVGRHLGRNLSIHYSVGIFDPVSILSLRYQINRYFSIQTQTSTIESAGDILYHLESKN